MITKRNGNGQTECVRCKEKGKFALNWDKFIEWQTQEARNEQKRMKVIDLLVDIANNCVSNETKHFKYFNRINEEYDIAMIHLSSIIYKLNNETIDLNDEIEIIEDTPKEDNKIEKDDLELDNQIFKYNPTDLEILIIREMLKNRVKIKEIIDRLNGDE